MDNGALQQKVMEILETGEVPPKVANRLIMAAIVENFKISKGNREILFGTDKKTGLITGFRILKKVNWFLIASLIGALIGLAFK